jgi:hypothetical protein
MQDERAYFPEIELTPDERAQLMQTISTPGQAVFNKVFKSVVDGYTTYLLNSPEGKPEIVVERLIMAKVAAQLFTSLVKHINAEIVQYKLLMDQTAVQKPRDDTAGLLDIGERPSTFEDVEQDDEIAQSIEEGL